MRNSMPVTAIRSQINLNKKIIIQKSAQKNYNRSKSIRQSEDPEAGQKYNLKFKKINRDLSNLKLPYVSRQENQKTVKSIIQNVKKKEMQKLKYTDNLKLLDLYLKQSDILFEDQIQLAPKNGEINERYQKCYSKKIISNKIDRLLSNKRILVQLNNQVINNKVNNAIQRSIFPNMIRKLYFGKMNKQSVLKDIYNSQQIRYDIAAQFVKIEQKINEIIRGYKQKQLDEISNKVQNQKKQIYQKFRNINYMMAKKSYLMTENHIVDTLKMIELQTNSRIITEQPYDLSGKIKNQEERLGKFPKINEFVLNQYKQISQKIQSMNQFHNEIYF